jgi:hypothetical protein
MNRTSASFRLITTVFVLSAVVGCTTSPATRPCTAQSTAPLNSPTRPLPIQVEEIQRTTPAGPVRGWAARIDLTDPRVELRVTGPVERSPDDSPRLKARTETTLAWLEREDLILAVNAHFFVRLDDGQGPVPTSAPVDLLGPCLSDGRLVSPGRKDKEASPVLAFAQDRRARIAMLTPSELGSYFNVVSGTSESGGQAGGLLVAGGQNNGAAALPRPLERHPRTAAGLTADRQTLILVVIDGRQPEWSAGLTLPELADLLISLGAVAAVNLDGGGSSSFIFAPPGGARVTNRPSDGHWRPVGTSLGIRVKPLPA